MLLLVRLGGKASSMLSREDRSYAPRLDSVKQGKQRCGRVRNRNRPRNNTFSAIRTVVLRVPWLRMDLYTSVRLKLPVFGAHAGTAVLHKGDRIEGTVNKKDILTVCLMNVLREE